MAGIGSSSTWSRTSASSSTSDGSPPAKDRALGWIRVTHPFPSILDGLVSGGVAAVAGAGTDLAVRVGAAMTLLQLGIGTVNDVVDALHDRLKPGKPIPSGLVGSAGARALAGLCFLGGIALAWSVGPLPGLIALLVVAIGLAYDLRLKGTAWSWLPFALGIPILPLFGWVAATGSLAPAFLAVVPAAMAAGAGLAIGNALVDVERDQAAGRTSVAAVLGADRAAGLSAGLYALVTLIAAGSGVAVRIPFGDATVVVAAGAAACLAAATAARRSVAGRERSWQVEAIALAILAVAWVRAVLS